jgi:hypothetical protein
MTKRIQIPVASADEFLFKRAARRAQLPVAEWARRLLRERAAETLGASALSPKEALAKLCAIKAPVCKIDRMIDESTRGRYR